MPYSNLSPRQINKALTRLAEIAAAEGVALEIALCHGRVITVAYRLDPDPLGHGKTVEPPSRATALLHQVTKEQRLPGDWMEEDVRFYLALMAARNQPHLHQHGPHLVLSVSEPAHLFAMKLHAFQIVNLTTKADHHDLVFLMEKMGLASIEAVEHAYARFFPEHRLSPEARGVVSGLLPA
jgi:hypothetical protein